MGLSSYEQSRQDRLEENKKRMEALNLPQLAKTLRTISTPTKSAPAKRRAFEKQLVAVRRSSRNVSKPAPDYIEVNVSAVRFSLPRSNFSKPRSMTGAYASDKARAWATEKAEELQATLDNTYPSFVRPMLPSHVSSCFWLGLPSHFCKKHLPKQDTVMNLINEQDEEYHSIYLPRKTGLSGGWKGFANAHELVDGDACVFELIKSSIFKVYIIRVDGFQEARV